MYYKLQNINIESKRADVNNPQLGSEPISTSCAVLSMFPRWFLTNLLKEWAENRFPRPPTFISFRGALIRIHHHLTPGIIADIACNTFIATMKTRIKMRKDFGFWGKGIMAGGSWRQPAAIAMGPRTWRESAWEVQKYAQQTYK
jgi:hypothetical protein